MAGSEYFIFFGVFQYRVLRHLVRDDFICLIAQFHYALYPSEVLTETRQLDATDTQRHAVTSVAELYYCTQHYVRLTYSFTSAASQMNYSSLCANRITFSALFKPIIFISQSVELVLLPSNYKLITCLFIHFSIKTERNII
jgi:hypothetical protein